MRGRRMPFAAVVAALALTAGAGCTAPPPLPSASAGAAGTATAEPGRIVDVTDLAVGDCLDDAQTSSLVTQVRALDCGLEHDSEVYFTGDASGSGAFPGDDAMDSTALGICLAHFTAFAGIDYDASAQLDIAWYKPSSATWQDGDRRIDCTIMRVDPETGASVRSTGTLRGAGV